MPEPQTATDPGLRRADDAALVAQARAGHHTAFSTLLERYRRRVYAKTRSILGSDETAEDACQETFLRAYEKLAVLREDGKFAAWLLTIATNVCTDQLRLLQETTADFEFDTLPDPHDDFEKSESRADLTSLIQELSPRMSLLARLHYVQGLDNDDIAASLNMPLGTVSGTLTRARQELRARLERNRRRDARWARSEARVKTQGVLEVFCPLCGQQRLEWRRAILPHSDYRLETYCPRCSSGSGAPITQWRFGPRTAELLPQDLFFVGHRILLSRVRRVAKGAGVCPECSARLFRIALPGGRLPQAGTAGVAWRCSQCAYEGDSRAAALALASTPVRDFWRDNGTVVIEDRDERIRCGGSQCWRLYYSSVRHQTRLAVVMDISSLRLISADLDHGRRQHLSARSAVRASGPLHA